MRHALNFKTAYYNVFLQDKNNKAIFARFRQTESSKSMFLLTFMFTLFFNIYRGYSTLAFYPSIMSWTTVSLSILVSLVGMSIFYFRSWQLFSKIYNEDEIWIPRLETVWLVGVNVVVDMMIATVAYNGLCAQEGDFGCNLTRHYMPESMMMPALILPMLLSMIIKSVEFKWVLFSWLINVLSMVGIMLVFDLTESSLPMLAYAILSLLGVYENQRQILSIYYLTQAQQNLLEENKRVAAENHTTEMRHMIGNVAHDLKTPLTAFLSGVELITTVLQEMESHENSAFSSPPAQSEFKYNGKGSGKGGYQVGEKISVIRDSIDNMRNVNAFMLMSINRCIDFTKSTNGLKLVPRLETVNLSETINLPLSCMKELQTRTTISLNAISSKVCANVITDKQWLQENILCLLSNAVKYSQQGAVKINITLLKKDLHGNQLPATDHRSDFVPLNQQQFKSQKQRNKLEALASLVGVKNANSSFSTAPSSHDSTKKKYRPEANVPMHKVVPLTALRVSSTDSNKDDFAGRYDQFVVVMKPNDELDGDDGNTPFSNEPRNSSDKSNRSLDLLEVTEPMIKVEVEDSGIGLSEEIMGNLFKPFKQAQRLAGGTGLGLYSLANRIDALGGKYGVEKRSDGKQGSVFWFAIPYRPDHTVEEKQNRRNSKTFNAQQLKGFSGSRDALARVDRGDKSDDSIEEYKISEGKTLSLLVPEALTPEKNGSMGQKLLCEGLHVLLVDDSFTILKMTTSMLVRKGHSVRTAENGVEAVEMVAAERARSSGGVFDVVLMDLQMPIMDGLEATRRIRASEIANHTGSKMFIGSDILSSQNSHQSLQSNGDFEIVEIGKLSTSKSFVKRKSHSTGLNLASPSNSVSSHMIRKAISGSPSSRQHSHPKLGASQKSPQMAHQFIIGVSANSDHETVKAAFLAGVDAFIPKPFTLQTFVDTYNEYCETLEDFS